MATVTAANGQILRNQSLEGALLALIFMAKELEQSGEFVQGQTSRIFFSNVNGLISFNGSLQLEASFDGSGNIVETVVPYLTGNANAPNVVFT